MVVVGDGHSHSLPEVLGDSRFGGDVGESAIAIVAVQSIREVRVVIGVTIGAQLGSRATVRIFIHFPLAVVGDEEVKQAVIVVVDPHGRDGPHLFAVEKASAYAGLVRKVSEGAVPVVVQQLILADIYDVDVGPTVIVIVSDRHTHSIADAGDTCLFGHIRKCPVMVVVVQAIPILRGFFLKGWDGGAVYQQNVEIAVIVVIQQAHAGDHRFRLILVWSGAAVAHESQTRAMSDLFKDDWAVG